MDTPIKHARLDKASRSLATSWGLTRTQQQALADLITSGRQWPMGRGHEPGDVPNSTCRYSHRTLQALVDAGVARWVHLNGLLPHIVPTTKVGA